MLKLNLLWIVYFRAEQQNAASRREFDLYDPESKKKDKPARVSDDDPRCQVSGLQLFQGLFTIYTCYHYYRISTLSMLFAL